MPRTARTLTARQFFGPRGLLSSWHPSYEFRPGQLRMAEEIEAALRERRHLIVEAGTGTGKTLAYLVPAMLDGRRVVISTGTKTLQEQLFFKDIPFLAQHFDRPIRAAYLKGRNNYACRQKIYDAEKEPVLEGLEEVADFEIIREWEKTTETGDRAEIRSLPESSSVWAKFDARRELCAGQRCPQFERCFITRMRQRALESDIVVVNHHLFFADLALKEDEFGAVIPDYAAVIFDEAHEIEDVAGQYFGVSLSNHQIGQLERDISALARRKGFLEPDLAAALESLEENSARFFSLFEKVEGRTGFPPVQGLTERHAEAYTDLRNSLKRLAARLELVDQKPEELAPIMGRLLEASENLRFLVEAGDENYVYWIERRNRTCLLQATPIDVAGILAERLFARQATVILTSATLAVGGSFDYTMKRLGITSARTLSVEGLFDYRRQALLYISPHLPDPRSAAFAEKAAAEIERLLAASQGRAFVLFTSYQQMQRIHDLLAYRLDFPILLQGTAPRTTLLEEFRTTPNAVLFATASFWQGVDVPGPQLSLVIIDKLPFAAPSDPVVEARIRRIRGEGGDPFYEYQVPQAVLALKQGFGRLIRSRSDRGVLALLDGRVLTQNYGRVFLESLPNYSFTTEISDVEAFFNV